MARPFAVANPKVTMAFDDGVQGWTESHMYTSQVPVTDTGLYNDAKALCAARVIALDGRYAQLVSCRFSLDNVNRDANHLLDGDIPPLNGAGQYPAGPPPASSTKWAFTGAHQAWPVVLQTGIPTVNPIEYITIGSIPQGQTDRNPDGPGGFNVAYYVKQYLAVLCSNKWGALYRNWTVTPPNVNTWTNTAIAFTAAAGGVPSQLAFTLANPPAASVIPFGALVRLQGSTYNSPQKRIRLNGTYTVVNYDPVAGIVTVNVPRLIVDPRFAGKGTLQVATGAVTPYSKGIIGKLTHRKRGRPLDAARGRR